MAGRKLANRPRFLRKPRIACSGRRARSSLSYFQSPTAPKSTASAACARASVAGGNGMPERLVRGAADQRMFGLEPQVERAENTLGLGDDLGADAVAGKDRDLHRMEVASQGCFSK